jgi:hypothetical protein
LAEHSAENIEKCTAEYRYKVRGVVFTNVQQNHWHEEITKQSKFCFGIVFWNTDLKDTNA